MSGIAGFAKPGERPFAEQKSWEDVIAAMNRAQKHRGPDAEGFFLTGACGLAQVQLTTNAAMGDLPMVRRGGTCAIVFDGAIYNIQALKAGLRAEGSAVDTGSDAEVILLGYRRHGIDYLKELNGVFSIAIWDEEEDALYLVRDRFGVKPLFYTAMNGVTVFASEIKGLFAYPGISPVIDREGLCEIIGLGPAKTYGKGVFKDVFEVLPGHYCKITRSGIREQAYWQLSSREHTESYADTVRHTFELLRDSIRNQMIADAPVCTFLSGGLDSSLVTAVCAEEMKKQGGQPHTFSFDFQESGKYFQANAFQPSRDRPYVEQVAEYLDTAHTYLECDHMQLIPYLYRAVDARDLPCMADVEASLLYFCSIVAKSHRVALTGECADELFGGYPWFHKEEMLMADTFPWSMDLSRRTALLKDDLTRRLPLASYVRAAYERTVQETPRLFGESGIARRRREMAYLNLRWFMATLLDRMDRAGMYAGLEARVPFADHRIVEYIWNVPWEMKCPNGEVKGLLKEAGKSLLPHSVLYRKKSPYPKIYHPGYEKALAERLTDLLHDAHAPIREWVDVEKAKQFIASPSDYGKPWYGQLMAGPQMLAYLLQINYWLEKYQIRIVA